MKPLRIHIFGASGSGTTTLGRAVSRKLHIKHLDTDSYYWQETDPPFTTKNSVENRLLEIKKDIAQLDGWVLSGSLCNWGDSLVQDFSIAIFVKLDQAVRLKRLKNREVDRYGSRIALGGDMHDQHIEFMNWAASYDTADAPVRSLRLHDSWANSLPCRVLELNSSRPVDELVNMFLSEVRNLSHTNL